jgi:toxin-antitoxin system PIN domain toxin
MTSYLIDINAWLALSWGLHPHSVSAHRWLASLTPNRTRLLFCRITQLGLLRLLTNKMVMGQSVLSVAGAFGVVDRWGEDPRVELAADPKGLDLVLRRAASGFGKEAATKAIMDAYLAAFAETERATLITFDKGLAKIGRRRSVPLMLLSSRGGAHFG